MPAVDISVLTTRLQSLQNANSNIIQYQRILDDILNIYTFKRVKLGETVALETFLPRLNVPDLVIEKIAETFPQFVQSQPENAEKLIGLLWDRDLLEYKLLAVELLFAFPASNSQAIGQHLPSWIEENEDEIIRQRLLAHLSSLEIHSSLFIRDYIESTLFFEDVIIRKFAFNLVGDIIQQKSFTDFPWLFQILTPIIQEAKLNIYRDLSRITELLIERSEVETAAFYHELCNKPENEKARKFIRKTIPLFSAQFQAQIASVAQK